MLRSARKGLTVYNELQASDSPSPISACVVFVAIGRGADRLPGAINFLAYLEFSIFSINKYKWQVIKELQKALRFKCNATLSKQSFVERV